MVILRLLWCDGLGYSALLGRDLGWEYVRSLVDLAITKKKQQEQHQSIVEPICNSEEYYEAPMSSSSDSLSKCSVSESDVYVQTSQVMLRGRPKLKQSWKGLTKQPVFNLVQLRFL